MVPRQPWFQRQFTFDLPVAAAAGLVERLRGTPPRLDHRLSGLSVSLLTARRGDRWSIQENAGHLWDLEPLWMARFEDIAAGRQTLEPADPENRRTEVANHNAHALPEILQGFRTARLGLVNQLEGADEADWLRSALHPRLKTPMRLLDLAFFVAEHDDHHLATITELLRWGG
jgi:uncharacterized damage-inducible protein DinB